MKKTFRYLLCSVLVAVPLGMATAGQSTHSIRQPTNGMTMQNVQHIFGAPSKKVPAVGDPPIARWVYPHFVVFFERNLVLHTVSKGKPFHDAPPADAVRHIVSGG
jgi:hypothetical protein